MNIRAVSPFGLQLTRFGLVNCFLVRERDSWTLIDTNLPGSAQDIVRAAREAAGGLPIGRVLLTHAHADHIGSLDALASTLGRVEVAISRREARLLPKKPAQDRTLDPGEPRCKIKGGFPGARTAPTHLLSDSELYGSLRCFSTPGHTPGHMALLDERDGTLYAGDALVTVGGRAHITGWAPWYFPLPNLATWHRPSAMDSARRLAELPVQRIAAGHGPVVQGSGLLMAALREAGA